MEGKSVIIIGAGLAGLAAGCYCRMNGYRTRIFEHHAVPGGVAAAWKRRGYTIDGGIHFLMDYRPGQPAHKIYRELGADKGHRFLDLDTYCRFIDQSSGRSVSIGRDPDRLAAGLKALFPGDAPLIDDLVSGVHAMQKAGMGAAGFGNPPELAGRLDSLRQMWGMRRVLKYLGGRYSRPASEYAGKARDPFLRKIIENLFLPEVPFWFVLVTLGIHAGGHLGLLEGGALDFALAIEKRYRGLGGEVTYKATVEEILVENGAAVGVCLADGSRHRADIVVSAADGRSTLFSLLGGRYLTEKIRRRYAAWKPCRPLLVASYGVAREFPGDPPLNTIFTDRPFTVNGQEIGGFMLRICNYSPHFAPPGKTVVQAEFETDWDYWNDLQREDRGRYDAEKSRLAAEMLERLEPLYPGISSQVEMTDVATPYTTWRYTRNHRGAYMGWMFTKEVMMSVMERTLPGLNNFYMAGQWVIGGSVPGCLYSGRHVAQIMCRREGRKFVTGIP